MQAQQEIEKFYEKDDPWGYDANAYDRVRRETLIREMSGQKLRRVLDIGCGNGFITAAIPATEIVGIDISARAIVQARQRCPSPRIEFRQGSLFDLGQMNLGRFDGIVITGVLYRHYIGESLPLVYRILDALLEDRGSLYSVHIFDWYFARFPYFLTRSLTYRYREFEHVLEVYRK